jgi:UDP-glucose 4-epimerase
MKRVLVTGGTGFVGANLIRRLLADGHEVHLLLRPQYSTWRIDTVKADVRLHVVDLFDAAATLSVVRRIRPDWIFHLAVYGAYPTQQDLRRMIDTNLVGTINLAEACLAEGFEAFVNTGSSSEYGYKDHAPPETEAIDPNSHYAVTKASATHFCRYTAQRHGVRIPTLRLYNIYGPFEEPARLFPTLIVRGLSGELPPLVRPEVARDYVYVEDTVAAYIAAATCPLPDPGGVYNVGTGIQTTVGDLVALARQEFGLNVKPQWGSLDNRIWDTSVWVAAPQKIEDELGWTPRHTVSEGFRQTVAWFRQQPDRVAFYHAQQVAASVATKGRAA